MAKFIHPGKVLLYADKHGVEPFTNWLEGLQDLVARKRILARLPRLEYGISEIANRLGMGFVS